MPSARRTSSCGSERRNSSVIRPPRERPSTICVTFSNLAKRKSSAATSLAASVLVSAPNDRASFMACVDVPARRVGELVARLLDRHGDPGRIHQVGKALCRAHDHVGVGVGADAGEDALAGRPRPLDRLRLHAIEEVGVDALGGAPQGELAQRRQVLRLEEALARAVGHVVHVDLALGEALQQLLGRQVDQHDLVGLLEHAVGHGLAHADARDLLQDVVQAFQVLDVERGPHVDAGGEQLLDVLPALGVAAAGDVAVGELVDEQQPRLARQRLVDVELAEDLVDVDVGLRGITSKPSTSASVSRRPCVSTRPMTTSRPSLLLGARRRQHGVGLADARSRARGIS